jgi:hypothetical protein
MTPRASIDHITAPALAVSAAYAAASAVDPIFPVLKEYVRRHAEWHRLCRAEDAVDGIARDARCFMPPSGSIDIATAQDAMDAAASRIFVTTPTTVVGVAELLRFVLDDPTEAFDSIARKWPRELFVAALDGLDNIAAAGGCTPGGVI